MRRLSKIIHLSKSGNLILKLESNMHPALGGKIIDSRFREIGKIQDIFGPVSRPYISISPTTSDPSFFVGKIAYAY